LIEAQTVAEKQNMAPNEDRIQKALDAEIPDIYFNGFSTGLTNSDVTAVLERNGRQIAVVHMSFTLAKTLSIALSDIITRLEQATDKEMLTTHELSAALAKHLGEN